MWDTFQGGSHISKPREAASSAQSLSTNRPGSFSEFPIWQLGDGCCVGVGVSPEKPFSLLLLLPGLA